MSFLSKLLGNTVSDEMRQFILLRDNYTCRYCAIAVTLAAAHIDHALPRSRGGSSELGNLRATCQDCNLEKGDKTESEYAAYRIRKKLLPQQIAPNLFRRL